MSTHLTAGASADKGTEPKPAARTAAACSSPRMKRVPKGIDSMAGFYTLYQRQLDIQERNILTPMSRTMKKNQSVKLILQVSTGRKHLADKKVLQENQYGK